MSRYVWKLHVFSGSPLSFKFIGRRGDRDLLGRPLALATGTPALFGWDRTPSSGSLPGRRAARRGVPSI